MSSNTTTASAVEGWRACMRDVCGEFYVQPSRQHSLFIGDVGKQELDGLEIARIRTNAGLLRRHPRSSYVNDDRHCFLVLQRSGRQIVRQGERSLELAPGDLALIDSALPFEIEPKGLIDNISIHLARDEVRRRVAGRSLFGKLSGTSNACRLLTALIQPIQDGDLRFCAMPGEGRALQVALIALMAPAFELGEQGMPPASVLCEPSGLYALALQLIDSSLQDCDFGPVRLAERLGVSVRRLYRLFEAEGQSVCRVIQRCRLQRSAEELAAGASAAEPITQVAFKWGFVDAAHFSRAFRRQFGMSPREYRAQAAVQ